MSGVSVTRQRDKGGEPAANGSVRAMHQYRLPAVNATYPPAEMDQPSTSDVEGELIPYAHRDIKPA